MPFVLKFALSVFVLFKGLTKFQNIQFDNGQAMMFILPRILRTHRVFQLFGCDSGKAGSINHCSVYPTYSVCHIGYIHCIDQVVSSTVDIISGPESVTIEKSSRWFPETTSILWHAYIHVNGEIVLQG